MLSLRNPLLSLEIDMYKTLKITFSAGVAFVILLLTLIFMVQCFTDLQK